MEETIRFIKQSYNLEDLRVLDYDRLKNMVVLVLAAAFFAAVRLGEDLKLAVLSHHVTRLAKRFFCVPDFITMPWRMGSQLYWPGAPKGPSIHVPPNLPSIPNNSSSPSAPEKMGKALENLFLYSLTNTCHPV